MRISVSLLKEDACLRTFEEYASANIFNMEFNAHDERYDDIDWDKLREFSERTGVRINSLHLPFLFPDILDISSLDNAVRARTVSVYTEYLKRGARIGIKIFVVHPSLEPIADSEREARMRQASESLRELALAARGENVRIAVENLPRSCLGRDSDEILRLTAVDENIGVCFDTNHLLTQPTAEFIRLAGHKFITTHISDYDFVDERHLLPWEGKIDWAELVEAMEKVLYEGLYNYEVPRGSTANITRSRRLTYEDFYDNYVSLMKNAKNNA